MITYYHRVRAWPLLPIMNSIQDTSRFPKKHEMARFSVLWFGSCIQLMSKKSQTLATQPHQEASFACFLKADKLGMFFKTLDQSLYLVHCFVFCLKANSKTAQCQCVLSLNWILLDCIFICLKHFTASWIGKMSSFLVTIRSRCQKCRHFVHFMWNFATILHESPHLTGKWEFHARLKILPPLLGDGNCGTSLPKMDKWGTQRQNACAKLLHEKLRNFRFLQTWRISMKRSCKNPWDEFPSDVDPAHEWMHHVASYMTY